jgi:hypothetical protein
MNYSFGLLDHFVNIVILLGIEEPTPPTILFVYTRENGTVSQQDGDWTEQGGKLVSWDLILCGDFLFILLL